MELLSIKHSGFENIYEGLKAAMIEKKDTFSFKLPNYLTHAYISLFINDVSPIELIYLKKIYSSINICGKTYKNFINKKTQYDGNQKISNLLLLHDEIINDKDVPDYVNADNVLPIGCVRYNIHITISGMSILSVTGAILTNMFSDDSGKLFGSFPSEKDFGESLWNMFVSKFKSALTNNLTGVDILTDYLLNRKYYQYCDGICTLSNIDTPHGSVHFLGSNANQLKNELVSIKGSEKIIPYIYPDTTYAHFVLNTSITSFIKIFLNTNYITDEEDLKVVFSNETCNVSEILENKYGNRLISEIEYITNFRKSLKLNDDLMIEKFNLILGGQKIRYNISIPFSKTDDFVEFLKKCNIDELGAMASSISSLMDSTHHAIGY